MYIFSLKVTLLQFLGLVNILPLEVQALRLHYSSLVMTIALFAVNSTLQFITLVKVLLPQSHIQNNGINLWGGSIPPSSLSLLAIQMHTNQELLSVNLSNGRDLLPPASSFSCVTHQVMSKSLQTKYLRIVIGKAKSKPEYIDDLSCFNYVNNSLKNSVFVQKSHVSLNIKE